MASCAFGPCGRDNETAQAPGLVLHEGRYICWLCYLLPHFAHVERCPNTVKATGTQCELVKHHSRRVPCRTSHDGKTEQALRDGDPKLAAERKRPLARKSNRAGPNWIPHNRRV